MDFLHEPFRLLPRMRLRARARKEVAVSNHSRRTHLRGMLAHATAKRSDRPAGASAAAAAAANSRQAHAPAAKATEQVEDGMGPLVDLVISSFADVDGYKLASAEKLAQRQAGVFIDGIQYGEIDIRAFAKVVPHDQSLSLCCDQPCQSRLRRLRLSRSC